MTKKSNKPRGEGQYHARIQMGCAVHPPVDIVLSSPDASSWTLARNTVEQATPPRAACLRCTTWFVRAPWPHEPIDKVTGDQIEDDIPF